MENTSITPSSAEDFQAQYKKRTAEILPLPSGLKVLAYRPSIEWWVAHEGILPSTVAARVSVQEMKEETELMTDEELVAKSNFVTSVVREAVIEPKVSLVPGPGEISPFTIDGPDMIAILRYAVGETEANGQSLAAFRRKSESTIATSTSGKRVVRPSEPVAGNDGNTSMADRSSVYSGI